MSRESVFKNMGNDFSSLEFLQEPDILEDQLNSEIWKTFETYWWLILICIFHGRR